MRNLIYGLKDPNTLAIRYVGQSSTGMRRPRSHFLPSSLRAQTYCARWIRRLSESGSLPEIVILEVVVDAHELSSAERWWIARLRSEGARLTNLTDGGEGMRGHRATPETRAKLSAARMGNRNAAGNTNRRGKAASIETRARISASLVGTRRRVGKVHSTESKVRMSRSHGGRPIFDQLGREYVSQAVAARALGLCQANIRAVLAGRRRHTKGYIFTYG